MDQKEQNGEIPTVPTKGVQIDEKSWVSSKILSFLL